MDRRLFLTQGTLALAGCAVQDAKLGLASISQSTDHPYAVAMWDYSWLLRTYDGGGFEDWDKALDSLVYRGYNALRIDCFPQLVSTPFSSELIEEFTLPVKGKRPALWGNEITTTIRPKEALTLFLDKCAERNLKIILSSWFLSHGTKRNSLFQGSEGLIAAWDETLNFINDHSSLEYVLYIDLLNEFPLWHGYQWLHDQLNLINPVVNKPFDFLNANEQKRYSSEQIKFYNSFINEVITKLQLKWPKLSFSVSQTNTLNTPWQDQDMSNFDVLDIHLWLNYNYTLSKETDYFQTIHTNHDNKESIINTKIVLEYYRSHRKELSSWLFEHMAKRSECAKQLNIPIGCTEGWGTVMWPMDAPDWTFIKEAGLLAAQYGAELDYAFNCSSNFTHPYFISLWDDIPWHQEVTRIIRKQ